MGYPADRPTDQPTDKASYRGALSHQKSRRRFAAILASFRAPRIIILRHRTPYQRTFEMIDSDEIWKERQHVFDFEHIAGGFLQHGHRGLHVGHAIDSIFALDHVTRDAQP